MKGMDNKMIRISKWHVITQGEYLYLCNYNQSIVSLLTNTLFCLCIYYVCFVFAAVVVVVVVRAPVAEWLKSLT